MSIADSLDSLKSQIPGHVDLIAVSKTKSVEEIQTAVDAGQNIFGENQAQEMKAKSEELTDQIHWHFIGHLQRNKVKYIAPFVKLIHSVDSLKLLSEIQKQALKNSRVIDYLVQVNISGESSKSGMTYEQCEAFITDGDFTNFTSCRIRGLMGIASLTDNRDQIRQEFRELKSFFEECKSMLNDSAHAFDTLSMGMSSDYTIAIEEGSTAVRIGSAIFGERNYPNIT